MSAIALNVAYLICCLIVYPVPQAITMGLIFSFSVVGIGILTRADEPLQAFQWFKRYPFRGGVVGLFTLFMTLLPIIENLGPWSEIALQSMLAFAWFWVFAALSTYWQSSEKQG